MRDRANSSGGQCCHRASLDPTAGFCGDCGRALLRCAAFEECAGLLDDRGACPVCVAPLLYLDAGGVRRARVGGELALPLVVQNASSVGRPLFLKGVWTRERGQDWTPMALSWDRLDAGASAPILAHATALERAGVHHLEVLIAFASRWRWREEVYAYSTGLAITVDGDQALSVQQNIHYAGDAPQTGATIYAPVRVSTEEDSRDDASADRQPLPLTRADRMERCLGLRGVTDGPSVLRSASLQWRGFEAATAPADGPLVTGDGVLTLGRSRAKGAGGDNDVRLLALTPDGRVDELASRSISRHHFSLYVENDRLMLRVESERGFVNDRAVDRGEAVPLADGDRFSPLPRGQGLLSIAVRIESHHGVADSIVLTKRPQG